MSEDALFRASTQYRLWSFSSEALASMRVSTNAIATERVRAAVKRTRNGSTNEAELECLTVEEEQKLVRYYCTKCMEMADFCKFPTNVKATAVQYMKRFYLSNSPMTYHPKSIMPSALFLATKTETHYTSLRSFAAKIPKMTAEDIIAPEFLVTQALRFTFDVRHPYRGLEGGVMELLALADGRDIVPGGENYQDSMRNMDDDSPQSVEEVKNRIRVAHGKSKELLKTTALLSDAYLLYTPAQIWLASLLVADEPLGKFYIDTKLGRSPELKIKLIATLRALAALLNAPELDDLAELRRIDKKLYRCRNPEKIDLVGLNQAVKREGHVDDQKNSNGEPAEGGVTTKKAKSEKEQLQRDGDVFGGPLTSR